MRRYALNNMHIVCGKTPTSTAHIAFSYLGPYNGEIGVTLSTGDVISLTGKKRNEVIAILQQFNVISTRFRPCGQLVFKTKQDAQNFLEYLSPYFVMIELTKGAC
jgi:hypothetical protein